MSNHSDQYRLYIKHEKTILAWAIIPEKCFLGKASSKRFIIRMPLILLLVKHKHVKLNQNVNLLPLWRKIWVLRWKSFNWAHWTSREMGLKPLCLRVVVWGNMLDPAVAKLTPWVKLDPTASRKAFKYGSPRLSAEISQSNKKTL